MEDPQPFAPQTVTVLPKRFGTVAERLRVCGLAVTHLLYHTHCRPTGPTRRGHGGEADGDDTGGCGPHVGVLFRRGPGGAGTDTVHADKADVVGGDCEPVMA